MIDLRQMHVAAEDYIERGWPIIPIPPVKGRPSKAPTQKDWPQHLLEAGDIASTLGEHWNVGLLLRDLVDVDLDCREAREAATVFLPATDLIYGHVSSPASHRLYRVTTSLPYKKFALPDDDDRGALLELRAMLPASNGTKPRAFQSLLPPSINPPTGEQYEWKQFGEASLVDAKALWRAIHLVAITAALARLHPPLDDAHKAGRDEYRLAISGVLARRLPEQDALNVFTAALRVAGDRKDRSSIFQTTSQKLRSDGKVKGVPALAAVIGQRATNSIIGWIDAISEKPQVQPYVAEVREPTEIVIDLPPRFSEEALALGFSAKHASDLRYVAGWGKWLRWDGTRWREDDTLQVFDLARVVCRAASAECEKEKPSAAPRLAAAATVAAVERLARADRRHAATIEQWDTDPWLLNTPNGTIHLQSAELRKHHREDCLTKLAGAGLAGESEDCPLWLRFLNRITGGDVDLQAFLQRMIGYCLTGTIREHALFFLYGTGANGKSVFLSTIADVLGEYAKTAPISTFLATGNEQHPTDLAGLRGARLVTAIETEDGRRWAEAKIKALTGDDPISARFMRQDFFQYTPQFKLLIAGNHKPGLRSVDEAIRRRMHLVPFKVTIPAEERDTQLREKLRSEYPAILRWAVEGCPEWQRQGLNSPAAVLDATANYLSAEDRPAQWIEERCEVGRTYSARAGELYRSWTLWCESAGEKPGSQKRFSQNLEDRGFERKHDRDGSLFNGLAPKAAL